MQIPNAHTFLIVIIIHRVTLNLFQYLRWMMNHAWSILKQVQDDTMRGFQNWILFNSLYFYGIFIIFTLES